jgi:DNA repair protein RecN (Recombination protein N)
MLHELQVSDLGVIEQLSLVFEPGMTALTGETGAGKTLVVEAIELLVGGRADPVLVRQGAAEAVVEGRFVDGDDELVLRRVVPASGRSRAYINGSMATIGALAEAGARLVDLHGQHDHQSLLSRAVQRAALDRFADIDVSPLVEARAALAAVEQRRQALGGDPQARARELELVRFQVDELDAVALRDPFEDERLDTEQDALGDAVAHQQAAEAAVALLSTDGGAGEQVALALSHLDQRVPFSASFERLRGLAAELSDLGGELRAVGEAIHDDPDRLDAIRERRKVLHDLRRKYGPTLADVMAFHDEARARLDQLVAHDDTAAQLDADAEAARAVVREVEAAVGRARRDAAPALQDQVESRLVALALPGARLEVRVGDTDPGDDVTFLFSANPGSPLAPLTKVASGGELARAMLALRLVLSEAPPTLIFDEVDAGVGGAAAIAVGEALTELGASHQVLVVTHLAQVAAGADHHVAVRKKSTRTSTSTTVIDLDDAEREAELARMLSGRDTARARDHARELRVSSARR